VTIGRPGVSRGAFLCYPEGELEGHVEPKYKFEDLGTIAWALYDEKKGENGETSPAHYYAGKPGDETLPKKTICGAEIPEGDAEYCGTSTSMCEKCVEAAGEAADEDAIEMVKVQKAARKSAKEAKR
jgi:hypothetical protein